MTARTMLYGGLIIPGPIVEQIQTRAADEHPFAEHACAFEVGALMAYCGRMPSLGITTARAEAFRSGQVYGASLRSLRCFPCKGRGVTECGTFICPECGGTGEAAREVAHSVERIREQMHVRTESIRADLHDGINAALDQFSARVVARAEDGFGRPHSEMVVQPDGRA